MRKAFTREQTLAAIRREGFSGVPVFQAKWWSEGLREQYGDKLIPLQEDYPDDLCAFWFREPGYETSSNGNPEYRMGFLDYSNAERHSIGNAVVLLPDWDQLDAFLDHYPSPKEAGIFDGVEDVIKNADGRYKIGCWWRFLHERLWTIRGMENLMYDYYDNMDGLKCICEKILEFDMAIVDECARLGFDGIFTSDDLGHQRGPMMSPEIFRELYLPYYKQFIGYVHSKGMQMFLHSCGDNTLLMEDLLEAGLDVFHPVQKGCMDMEETARRFGGRITFLAGMDVQHTLVEATPEEVREEVRRMKRIFGSEKGGLLLAMGNGILSGTPLENIRAALDEMYAE